jgi:hypothetical protein
MGHCGNIIGFLNAMCNALQEGNCLHFRLHMEDETFSSLLLLPTDLMQGEVSVRGKMVISINATSQFVQHYHMSSSAIPSEQSVKRVSSTYKTVFGNMSGYES